MAEICKCGSHKQYHGAVIDFMKLGDLHEKGLINGVQYKFTVNGYLLACDKYEQDNLHYLEDKYSQKEEVKMILTVEGCVLHRNVQFDRCEDGHQVFKCLDCGHDVAHEADDAGSGC